MSISYDGIGYLAVTMQQDGCELGQVCALDAEGRACPCAADAKFCGVVTVLEGTMVAVQVEGFVKVHYSVKPAMGYNALVADGNGGVKTGGAGREYLVVAVDPTMQTAIIKL